MALIPNQLNDVLAEVRDGKRPSISVRSLLSWFGAKRRGSFNVSQVRAALKQLGLVTVPDFEFEYIDSSVFFEDATPPAPVAATEKEEVAPPQAVVATPDSEPAPLASLKWQDPAYSVRKLEAANRAPVRVTPDTPVTQAITLMLAHDFSQLPVMTSERKVLGMVSWKSIGSRLATGSACTTVQDAIGPVTVVPSQASIFQVAELVAQHEVVLVQESQTDPKVNGILTSTDLAIQFGQLGEPFLLLGEIENRLRQSIDGKFTTDELKAGGDPNDTARTINGVFDLTFGEYVRLLQSPERFERCYRQIDRSVFIEQLEQVRGIRNDIMHFDPEGIGEEELDSLRRFAAFLGELAKLGADGGVAR